MVEVGGDSIGEMSEYGEGAKLLAPRVSRSPPLGLDALRHTEVGLHSVANNNSWPLQLFHQDLRWMCCNGDANDNDYNDDDIVDEKPTANPFASASVTSKRKREEETSKSKKSKVKKANTKNDGCESLCNHVMLFYYMLCNSIMYQPIPLSSFQGLQNQLLVSQKSAIVAKNAKPGNHSQPIRSGVKVEGESIGTHYLNAKHVMRHTKKRRQRKVVTV